MAVRTSLLVYADGVGKAHLGGARLSWDSHGVASLSLSFKRSMGINVFQRITATYKGVAVFDGRVRSLRRSDFKGVVEVVATDWKDWLGEVPLFLQCTPGPTSKPTLHIRLAAGGEAGAAIQAAVNNSYGTVVPTSVGAAWASADAWDALTMAITNHTYSAESVRGVIESIVGKYYAGYGWRYNPVTGMLQPVATYYDAPYEYRATQRRLFLDDVEPCLEGCFTNVAIEGRHETKVAFATDPTTVTGGFIGAGPFEERVSDTTYIREVPASSGHYFAQTTNNTFSGIDPENNRVKKESNTADVFAYDGVTGYPYGPATTVIKAGSYHIDARYQVITGWGGTAYSLYGIMKTMAVVDEELGDSVYVTNPTTGESALADRSATMAGIANGVWLALRDIRYSGKLVVPGEPNINPLQRVTVSNHPTYGSLTFRPNAIDWSEATGLLTYSLGDSKYNPIEELSLRAKLSWRDHGYNAKRATISLSRNRAVQSIVK